MPTADISLYDKLVETLRITILKAFRDPVFCRYLSGRFADCGSVASVIQ
jgi:hypothetical protein